MKLALAVTLFGMVTATSALSCPEPWPHPGGPMPPLANVQQEMEDKGVVVADTCILCSNCCNKDTA